MENAPEKTTLERQGLAVAMSAAADFSDELTPILGALELSAEVAIQESEREMLLGGMAAVKRCMLLIAQMRVWAKAHGGTFHGAKLDSVIEMESTFPL